jgi:hypothetical protein
MPKTFESRRLYPARSELQQLLWVLFAMLGALLVISYIPAFLQLASAAILGIRPEIASL